MAKEKAEPTTLIIGAGVFGVSTAYHLSRSRLVSPSSITVVDLHPFPSPPADSTKPPYGASHDINKIVRADYSSPFYMKLAQEAIERWQDWDVIKNYYHKTGWVMLNEKDSNLAERIRRNFRERDVGDETRDMSFDEVKSLWGGLLKDIDLEEYGSAYWNPGAGWAEADKAVEAILTEAINSGVVYRQGQVVELSLRADVSGVEGVKLGDGSTIQADRIVLATGAWTSQLMSEVETKLNFAAPNRVESQLKAAGVCVVNFELGDKEKERYDKLPVVVYGSKGEVLPPPPNRLLKFTNAGSFTNRVNSKNGELSVPRPLQRSVPESLKMETLEIIYRVAPSMLTDEYRVAFWRICWDAITPQQHPLITRSPQEQLSNLFFAVGGSFHSWKFLPTIGQYAANVILGESNGKEIDQNFSWKPEGWTTNGDSAHEKVIPKRDLKDLI